MLNCIEDWNVPSRTITNIHLLILLLLNMYRSIKIVLLVRSYKRSLRCNVVFKLSNCDLFYMNSHVIMMLIHYNMLRESLFNNNTAMFSISNKRSYSINNHFKLVKIGLNLYLTKNKKFRLLNLIFLNYFIPLLIKNGLIYYH